MKTPRVVLLVAVLFCCAELAAEESRDPRSLGFIKGFSWGYTGRRGDYAAPAAAESMRQLADTGTEWACIAFAPNMPTHDTPEIRFSDANPDLVSDDEIRHAIDLARHHGMQVILKPMINCADHQWRAWIRFFRPITDDERARGITGELDPWGGEPKFRDGEVRDTEKWDRWWDDYAGYIVHYARIAEQKGVPVYCLGCEMNSTEEFDDRWRELIAQVRDVYSGLITYNLNHDRDQHVDWLDAVDFISVSAYHPIPFPDSRPLDSPTDQTTTVEEIAAGMRPIRDRLAEVSRKWNKPILFIEAGVSPVRGSAHTPWEYYDHRSGRQIDLEEQANYYQAMFETYWNEPWFLGWCWWEWPARLGDPADAPHNRSFAIYAKPAEQVLRTWYAKERTP